MTQAKWKLFTQSGWCDHIACYYYSLPSFFFLRGAIQIICMCPLHCTTLSMISYEMLPITWNDWILSHRVCFTRHCWAIKWTDFAYCLFVIKWKWNFIWRQCYWNRVSCEELNKKLVQNSKLSKTNSNYLNIPFVRGAISEIVSLSTVCLFRKSNEMDFCCVLFFVFFSIYVTK